ncbi:pyridoxamine 5'-phosphate oxidase family protein [Thalassococcus sp. BH17M4-6]|uniref:pyridoxamine 5'-phosphate oxidase family protein n=1 Tax=Thalassococcus sp. BH17M4-6 TaxID=3413148 RepID=UPI003BC5F841
MTDLTAFLDKGWDLLAQGVARRDHAARHVVLASLGADGPEQRILVLRGADRDAGRIELHTDSASAKVTELARDPRAAVLVWVPEAQMQLRLAGRVAFLHADPDRWGRIPQAARTVYGGAPRPGTPIDSPEAFVTGAEIDRFTVLLCHLRRIEVLELGDRPHRRAVFDQPGNGWRGRWVAP